MWIPPLLIIPFLIYNAVAFDLVGNKGLSWAQPVASFNMLSGAVWTLSVADLLVIFALALLLLEGVRTWRAVGSQFSAAIGAAAVFVLYLGEFMFFPAASTSLFFTCMAMSFVDMVSRVVSSRRSREQGMDGEF
ncbi:MAG TPA: hypothetical protein ENJ90_12155 [Devosia sp.]|nr:hypothetical protein [Devosia sp.]